MRTVHIYGKTGGKRLVRFGAKDGNTALSFIYAVHGLTPLSKVNLYCPVQRHIHINDDIGLGLPEAR